MRNIVWVTVILVIVVMFQGLAPLVAQQDSLYRTYWSLVEVDALIRKRFVEPVTDQQLLNGAVRGMMQELDPYCGYVAPDEMDSFDRRHQDSYVGIGVELAIIDGEITVVSPIDESPAMQSGVLPGDVIVAINGSSVEGYSLFAVEKRLLGQIGSTVALRLARVADRTVSCVVNRDRIRRTPVKGIVRNADGSWQYIIPEMPTVAYVRIAHFIESAASELGRALYQIRDSGARYLVLDLRFNPGGLLPEAVGVADRFIESGKIVATVTRREAVELFLATKEDSDFLLPMAILINGASASAAEIVAGALQDHGRAIVVGARSFGKGSVQDLIPIRDGQAAIKLTVAHYQLPSGRIIHRSLENLESDDWGISPDISVPLDDDQYTSLRKALLGMSESGGVRSGERSPTIKLSRDSQLKAAVDAITSNGEL